MHIFNAKLHFLTSDETTHRPKDSNVQPTTALNDKVQAQSQATKDSLDSAIQRPSVTTHDSSPTATTPKKIGQPSTSTSTQPHQPASTTARSSNAPSASLKNPQPSKKRDPIDESWAISMLKEMGEEVEELEVEQRRRLKQYHQTTETHEPAAPSTPRFAHVSHEELHEFEETYFVPKPRKYTFWYISIILFGIAGLFSQYLYTNMESLSSNENFRKILMPLCEYSGCILPPFIDIDQLKVNTHTVRLDEETPGQLTADAIIINNAAFDQPFPTLKITFRTTSEQLVAERLFKPSDYLSPDSQLLSMPPGKPVHVSVKLNDPGETAVNYVFSFLAPPQEGL